MKPPFAYYGGKQTLISWLHTLIKDIDYTTYVEPFTGSGALYFSLPQAKQEILNDRDERIVNFFRVLQDPELAKDLKKRLDYTLYSRQEFERAKETLESSAVPIDRAWAWFVLIQQSFAHQGRAWGYGLTPKARHVAAVRTSIDLLPAISKRLAHAQIECRDGVKLVAQCGKAGCFLFVDPPYPGTETRHMGKGFDQAEFEKLCDALADCEASFILTCYPNKYADSKGWERFEVQRKTSAAARHGKGKAVTEVAWRRIAPGAKKHQGLFE